MRYVTDEYKGSRSILRLDLEGLELNLKVGQFEKWIEFPINFYNTLKKMECVEWDIRMECVNKLFATMKPVELVELVEALVFINATVHRHNETVVNDLTKISMLTTELSGLIKKMLVGSNLLVRAKEFVESEYTIEEVANRGKRVQDTAPGTFYPYEERRLLELALVCKILLPVYGLYMKVLKPLLANQSKDRHCASVVMNELRLHYDDTIKKLFAYAKKFINASTSNSTAKEVTGDTVEIMETALIDRTVVRILVNAKLYNKEPKILHYISSTYKSFAQYAPGNKLDMYRSMSKPVRLDGDEGNESALESSVLRSSKYQGNLALLIRSYIPIYVAEILNRWELPLNKYQELIGYYADNVYQITNLTVSVLCKLFSADLGGSLAIRQLRFSEFNRLVCLAILQANKLNAIDAIPLLTPKCSIDSEAETAASPDIIIYKRYMDNAMYVKLREYYDVTVTNGAVLFDEEFENNLVSYTTNYKLNVCPSLQSNDINLNDMPLKLTITGLGDICKLIVYSQFEELDNSETVIEKVS